MVSRFAHCKLQLQIHNGLIEHTVVPRCIDSRFLDSLGLSSLFPGPDLLLIYSIIKSINNSTFYESKNSIFRHFHLVRSDKFWEKTRVLPVQVAKSG